MSLALLTAAAAGLGLPHWVWIVTMAVSIALGVLAVAGALLAHRRRAAREKALQRVRYLHLTGMASIAWLFDVMHEDPSTAGVKRAEGIVLTWVGNVIDALEVAAPHKNFAFANAVGVGVAVPAYRGLTHDQAAQVEMLLRQVERLGTIIEEISGEIRA